jgi:hypothetical protein
MMLPGDPPAMTPESVLFVGGKLPLPALHHHVEFDLPIVLTEVPVVHAGDNPA